MVYVDGMEGNSVNYLGLSALASSIPQEIAPAGAIDAANMVCRTYMLTDQVHPERSWVTFITSDSMNNCVNYNNITTYSFRLDGGAGPIEASPISYSNAEGRTLSAIYSSEGAITGLMLIAQDADFVEDVFSCTPDMSVCDTILHNATGMDAPNMFINQVNVNGEPAGFYFQNFYSSELNFVSTAAAPTGAEVTASVANSSLYNRVAGSVAVDNYTYIAFDNSTDFYINPFDAAGTEHPELGKNDPTYLGEFPDAEFFSWQGNPFFSLTASFNYAHEAFILTDNGSGAEMFNQSLVTNSDPFFQNMLIPGGPNPLSIRDNGTFIIESIRDEGAATYSTFTAYQDDTGDSRYISSGYMFPTSIGGQARFGVLVENWTTGYRVISLVQDDGTKTPVMNNGTLEDDNSSVIVEFRASCALVTKTASGIVLVSAPSRAPIKKASQMGDGSYLYYASALTGGNPVLMMEDEFTPVICINYGGWVTDEFISTAYLIPF